MTAATAPRRDLLRVVVRHRRLVVAGLVALAVAAALPVVAPSGPASRTVLTVTRDLAPGTVLVASDLTARSLPLSAVPDGAVTAGADLVGRVVAGGVRRGETLTDIRVLGPALLAGLSGDLVAVPVRLADPAAAALLRAGDRVDVLAASTTPDGPPGAETVAAAVQVLAVPAEAVDDEGALVVLATSTKAAGRLAAVAVTSRLSVVVRP